MIDLYAVQLEAEEATIADARKRARITTELVKNWIETAYRRQFNNLVIVPQDDFSLDLQKGRVISKSTIQSDDGSCSISKFTFTYPDRNDGNLLWTARIHVTHFRELLDFSMRLGIDSSQFVLAPVTLKVGRPQLIPALLSSHKWNLGGTRVTSQPIIIQTIDVDPFVTERLLSPERRLPVVIISRVADDDSLLIDSRDVANHLAGISEVYELADKWASFKLTGAIGRGHACYNGAVRIYWPRGSKTLDSFNPVILPREIALLPPHEVRNRLFAQLSQISALRFIDGPITVDATESIERERAEKTEREKESARAAGNTDELIAIAEEEVRDLRVVNDRLKKEVDQLRRDHSLLASDLRTTQDNLRAIWSSPNSPSALEEDAIDAAPETVLGAVNEAAELFGETLVFHQKAFDSAQDSPFNSPEDVKYALLAMHEVCLQLRESRSSHTPIGRLEDRFSEKGFTYKAHESETSMSGKMGEERKLLYKGQKISIEKHLALGKGGPDTCLRVYFHDDEVSGKFIVGHVGRHKTNTKT